MPLRVWITDGSLPVFSDTQRLETRHDGTFGMSVPYEGFVDPAVPVGAVELDAERVDDVLCLEAEWCVLTEGLPEQVDASTPVRLQGLIEGKWMNRLLGTKRWQPASIANSLLAEGPGIETTLGELEHGTADWIEIAYVSEAAGRRTHSSTLADLHRHNVVNLVNEVLERMRHTGDHVDAIDLGALGERAAVVNEQSRIKAAARPLPLPHVSKERLVRRAIADGVGMRARTEATIDVWARDGSNAGHGTLTWRPIGA